MSDHLKEFKDLMEESHKINFTPGPFHVEFSVCEDMTFAIIEKENHKTIAEVFLNDNEDEQEANANLISAAPEMYKEIQYFCKICDTHICALCGIGKLLRKAKGESEETK